LACQLPANLFGYVYGNGTRVGLLFRDTVARKQIDDRFGFDFQLASQFVDAYLICVVHLILVTAWRSGSCLRETRSLFHDSVLPAHCFQLLPIVRSLASCLLLRALRLDGHVAGPVPWGDLSTAPNAPDCYGCECSLVSW
jgi:hypothetical protein